MKKKNEDFLYDIGRCKTLNCSDLRLLLLCYEKELPVGEIMRITGWNRQNTSRTAHRLIETGLIQATSKDNRLRYLTNTAWRLPEIPGQLTFDLDT